MKSTAVLFIACISAHWSWIGGPQGVDQPGNFGVRGVFSSSSIPPSASYSSGTFVGDDLYAVYGAINLNNLWLYNISSNEWAFVSGDQLNATSDDQTIERMVFRSSAPTRRTRSTAIFYDSDSRSVFIGFGTPGSNTFSDAMFQYNFSSGLWRWVAGSLEFNQLPVLSPAGVENSLNTPGSRYQSASFFDSTSGCMFLFGGYVFVQTGHHAGDFWRFNVTSFMWAWIKGPQNTSNGVFGRLGIGTEETFPSSRGSMSFEFDTNNRVFYMFGGVGIARSGILGHLADMWSYDVRRNIWTWVSGAADADVPGVSGPRGKSSVQYYPGSRASPYVGLDTQRKLFYVWAGYLASKCFNDLWRYDLNSTTWALLSGRSSGSISGRYGEMFIADVNNIPPPRTLGVGFYSIKFRKFVIHQGEIDTSSGTPEFNDVWQYQDELVEELTNSNTSEHVTSRSATTTTRRANVRLSTTTTQQFSLSIIYASLASAGFLLVSFIIYWRRRTSKALPKAFYGASYGLSVATSIITDRSTNTNQTLMTNITALAVPGHKEIDPADYILTQQVASGGGGEIYLARPTSPRLQNINSILVAKVCKDIDSSVFFQELSIMELFKDSPYFAKFYGFCTNPLVLLMKYYPDGSLKSYSEKKKFKRSLKYVFAKQIAAALLEMHSRDLAHRDLKPQNVLIDRDQSNRPLCALTDFGITQVLSDQVLLVKAFNVVNIRGLSIQYAAPEVFQLFRLKQAVTKEVLKAGDLYSYACLVAFLLCQVDPWGQ